MQQGGRDREWGQALAPMRAAAQGCIRLRRNSRSGAGAGEDYADGAQDDLEIEPDAPVFDVGHVERDVAVEGGILASLHLPEAGDAGRDIEAAQMAELVLLDFAGDAADAARRRSCRRAGR